MSEQRNNQDNQREGLAQGIKDTAGAAFHAVHKGLETVENTAMTLVDQTSEVVQNVAGDNQDNHR